MQKESKFCNFTAPHPSDIKNILLILVVGLLSLTWFRGDFLINYGDQSLPLSPIWNFQNNAHYAWSHQHSTGLTIPRVLSGYLYFGFWALFEVVGFSLVVAEKVLYYFLFTFSGLSMYYLITSLIDEKKRCISGLTAALFYMFNFFPILAFWRQFTGVSFLYALLPMVLGLYIRGLNTKKIKYFFLILLLLIIFSPVALNPSYVVILWFILFSYLIFYIFQKKRKHSEVRTAFKLSGILLFLWVGSNLWWILPIVLNIKAEIAGATATGGTFGAFAVSSSQTSFLNLFRLLGPWHFTTYGWGGDPYFSWAWIYFTPVFLILGFIPPILAFLPFLAKRKNKPIFFFGPLFLVGLFLMKGMHPPLGGINKWMFLNIPFFEIFRVPYDKFGTILALSHAVLVGMGFGVVYLGLRKYTRRYIAQISIAILSILLFGVYMWPFWTGDIIYAGGKITSSARISVPNYYYQAGEWIQKQPNEFKILSLPRQEGAAYNWKHGGYMGSDDPTRHILQRPLLTQTIHAGVKFLDQFLLNLLNTFDKPNERIVSVLGLTNIKYILVHKDINYFVNTPNPNIKAENIKSILDLQEGIYLEKSFGKLDFYKIDDKYFLPHIYSSATSTIVDGGIEMLASLAETKFLDGKPVLFFDTQEENQRLEKRKSIPKLVYTDNKWELLEPATSYPAINQKPEIIFKKINPTKYLVKVEKAEEPFWLVFNESFHKQWRLYNSPQSTMSISPQMFKEIVADYPDLKVKEARHLMKFSPQDIRYLFKKPLDTGHFLVNGYANGWFIEPKKLGLSQDFTLVLYFLPQSLFYLGLGISGLTFLGCIGYLLWPKRRKSEK